MARLDANGSLDAAFDPSAFGTVRSLAVVWDLFEKGGAEAFKAWSVAHLPGFLANTASWLLGLWSWAVTGLIGVILAFIFGRHNEHA